jgi:hypothetical protein
MDLPSLRHFRNDGIFYISSDLVEALHGEAWVPAIYTDKGWATADGSTLLTGIEEWRDATEAGQIAGCSISQHQKRDEERQTAKASGSNRAIKSRKSTQAKG